MSDSHWKKFISNFDQNSAFFSLVLALMSFCAILVSLLTLNEMQTQRELSMTPIIYPQDFKPVKVKSDSICDSTIFSYKIHGIFKEGDSLTQKPYTDWFKLGFVNVGKGSAVNIKFTWDFGLDYFTNSLDTLQIEPWIYEFKKNQKVDNNYRLRFFDCDTGSNSIFSNKVSTSYTHLLPATDTNKEFHTRIPFYVLPLHIAHYRSLWLKEGQLDKNTSFLTTKHHLNLQYESVNGNKYSTDYEVEIEIIIPNVTYLKKGVYASWEDYELYVQTKKL